MDKRKPAPFAVAWEAAYREHHVAVYHTALEFLKNAAAAEDISQEVFLALHSELSNGGRIRHLRAWLLTTTRNRCMNHLRDHRRECLVEDTDAVWAVPVDDGDGDAVFVKALLSRLPQEERLVFCLHCLDGYSYRELAEGLSLPIGTVQTRVRAARRRLRCALKEESI